ncbi:MAG: hypothetical protein RSD40_05995 [Bacilli bacterium]
MDSTQISFLSLGISVLSFLGAFIGYLIHDRKLKYQSKIINKYQIEKIQDEADNKKKAFIKGNIQKGDKGRRTLYIVNSGKAIARNIQIDIPEDNYIIHNKELFPFEQLNPQDHIEINFTLYKGSPDSIKLKYVWDDNFKSDNINTQVLAF